MYVLFCDIWVQSIKYNVSGSLLPLLVKLIFPEVQWPLLSCGVCHPKSVPTHKKLCIVHSEGNHEFCFITFSFFFFEDITHMKAENIGFKILGPRHFMPYLNYYIKISPMPNLNIPLLDAIPINKNDFERCSLL